MEEENHLSAPSSVPPVLLPTHARTLTTPIVTMPTVDSSTDVRHVVDPTWHKVAPCQGNSALSKSLPWTPLQLFIIKRELSNHPDKVFARQLIDN